LVLLRESENDDLTGVMQDLIEIYGEQLLPFAASLAEHLVYPPAKAPRSPIHKRIKIIIPFFFSRWPAILVLIFNH
jgi:hypothetical protein